MKYLINYSYGGGPYHANNYLSVIKCINEKKECSEANAVEKCLPDTEYTGKCINSKCETRYFTYNLDITNITKRYKPESCNIGNDFYNFNCFSPINKNGINIVKINENIKLFKGMRRTKNTNLDLENIYGNKKAWYSDFEIASLYARKDSEGLHVYKPQRELVLFCLNDTNNLKLLHSKISDKVTMNENWLIHIEKFIETLQLIIKGLNSLKDKSKDKIETLSSYNEMFFSEDNGLEQLKNYCNYGENWRQSQTVLDSINNIENIFKIIKKIELIGGALVAFPQSPPELKPQSPPELKPQLSPETELQIEPSFRPQPTRLKRFRSIHSDLPIEDDIFRNINIDNNINNLLKFTKILLSEIVVYPEILEVEKTKLFNKKDHISFTTGYGMTWIEQIKYMQEKLIDRSDKTKRFNFNFRNTNPNTDFIGYDKRNKSDVRFLKFKINNSLFGKGKTDLNRISLSTDEDLTMCDIIEEFFNVDGYWSNSVISYFHERGTFPREICIFNNRILNRVMDDPMDWVTYSKSTGIPKLPDSYVKILYYKFSGEIDTKGVSEDIIDDFTIKSNVPIEPLTYIFRGYKKGDSVNYNLLEI